MMVENDDKDNKLIVMEVVSAPTNIACIKYWGKADVSLNTPINDSVSVTLDQTDLRAVTTVAVSKQFTSHQLWLNGVKETIGKRFLTCLEQVRALANDSTDFTKEEYQSLFVHVSSYNTFPTAAGLASSAAGYAALVYALAKLYHVPDDQLQLLSSIARQGSGSACRSLYGGFVAWKTPTPTLSHAVPIAPHTHWPDLRAFICVVSHLKKETSSTSGMMTSVATSPLLAHRAKELVQPRMEAIETAFLEKDFPTFAKLTMMDSNQFHATCLDTYPPIFYLNDTSKQIIQLIHTFNESNGTLVAAYTFDAGPNAVIYTTTQHAHSLSQLLVNTFPTTNVQTNPTLQSEITSTPTTSTTTAVGSGPVETIYYTKSGPGPQRLTLQDATLDPITGLNTYTP